MIVVDDHTLLVVLAGRGGPDLGPSGDAAEVWTTGSWYYRLARAVRDRHFAGSLSRRLTSLPPDLQRVVVSALEDLPAQIGVLSPRVLVPVMASLSEVGHFNVLHAEALASALILEAGIRVVASSDLLRSACSSLGIPLTVVPV